jgi:hypothetical protein
VLDSVIVDHIVAACLFFLFFWSVWDNEIQSAEAFQAHPLVMLGVSQSLPGIIVQEEMPLRINITSVGLRPLKLSYPNLISYGPYTH